MKKKEKNPPQYSVLNPETNSDSPSIKSKGNRLDSANITIIQIIKKGSKKRKLKFSITSCFKFNFHSFKTVKIEIKRKIKITS